MRLAVLRFAGSRGDDEALVRCREALRGEAGQGVDGKGAEVEVRQLADDDKGARGLRGVDAVLLTSDFGGDAVLARAAAASPLMSAVAAFAERGGPVLGCGDGFRLLAEAGLLDGSLEAAAAPAAAREVHVVVEGRPTPFTSAIPAGRILRMALPEGAARYLHHQPDLLEREGRVVLRYVDESGGPLAAGGDHPTASTAAIAGVTNAAGNVVGLAPRPERTCGPASQGTCGHGDGRSLFDALLRHLTRQGGRVLARG